MLEIEEKTGWPWLALTFYDFVILARKFCSNDTKRTKHTLHYIHYI